MADCRLFLGFNEVDAATYTVDGTGRHDSITFNGTAAISSSNPRFGVGCLWVDGDSDYLTIPVSSDWNILADNDEDWCIECMVKHDDHTSIETYLSQYESSGNFWELRHSDGNGVLFYAQLNSVIICHTVYAGEITDTLWHHVMMCKVDGAVGVYLDGQQVGWDASIDSVCVFAADLTVGALGSPTTYFDGRMDQVAIWKGNPFNAAPNSGKTDTISVFEDTGSDGWEDYELLPEFPTVENGEISRGVDVTPFSDNFVDDGVRRTNYAEGNVSITKCFPFQPRTIGFTLSNLTDADKDTIFTFYEDHGGRRVAVFNPADSLKYAVIFASPPTCDVDDEKGFWKMSFEFRQVSSTTWS